MGNLAAPLDETPAWSKGQCDGLDQKPRSGSGFEQVEEPFDVGLVPEPGPSVDEGVDPKTEGVYPRVGLVSPITDDLLLYL